MRRFLSAGPVWRLAAVVLAGILPPLALGLLVDRRLETAPLFSFFGAMIGILAATYFTVRVASRAIEALGHPAQPAQSVGQFVEEKEGRA